MTELPTSNQRCTKADDCPGCEIESLRRLADHMRAALEAIRGRYEANGGKYTWTYMTVMDALNGKRIPDETTAPRCKHDWSALRANIHECLNDGCGAFMTSAGIVYSPEEPTRKRLRDSADAAFNLGVLPTEQSEKATSATWDCACNEVDCPYCANRNALNGTGES